jgi:arylsulfatase A-like enzyme
VHRFVNRCVSRFLPLLRIGVCLLVAAGCDRTTSPDNRPNVVLITLDTTRADRLSCYGYGESTSPNLDRLAERGVLFSRAIAQAAVTPVSHASILTGLNPYTHGLRVMHGLTENRLRDSCVTLAEVLRDAGYRTGAFVSAFPVTERFGLQQGFEVFDASFLDADPETIVSSDGTVNTGRNQRRADETTQLAVKWLAQAPHPFLLWLHYFDPHDPMVIPPEYFLNRFPAPPRDRADALRALYDIEIRFMDEQIGRVLDQLDQSGRLDRTIIVVVADHGEGLGDHNWWTHGILYQEQIHVPFILCGPSIPAGRRIDFLVRTIDIMPTILELTGLPSKRVPAMDGHSLVALWSPGAADPGFQAYADSINMLTYRAPTGGADSKNDILFALTDGEWKYIHHALRPAESELYNLKDDPRELNNLFGQHPRQVARLLIDLRSRDCFPKEPPGREQMSEDDLRRLRSLGYAP